MEVKKLISYKELEKSITAVVMTDDSGNKFLAFRVPIVYNGSYPMYFRVSDSAVGTFSYVPGEYGKVDPVYYMLENGKMKIDKNTVLSLEEKLKLILLVSNFKSLVDVKSFSDNIILAKDNMTLEQYLDYSHYFHNINVADELIYILVQKFKRTILSTTLKSKSIYVSVKTYNEIIDLMNEVLLREYILNDFRLDISTDKDNYSNNGIFGLITNRLRLNRLTFPLFKLYADRGVIHNGRDVEAYVDLTSLKIFKRYNAKIYKNLKKTIEDENDIILTGLASVCKSASYLISRENKNK